MEWKGEIEIAHISRSTRLCRCATGQEAMLSLSHRQREREKDKRQRRQRHTGVNIITLFSHILIRVVAPANGPLELT